MVKILLIKLRYIGDTLTLLPLVRAIKKHRPDCHLVVMVYKGTEGILAHQKGIDELILLDREEIKQKAFFQRLKQNLKTWKEVYQKKFDWVIDLTSSDRSALLCLATRAPRRIGVPLGNVLERFAYHALVEGDPQKTHINEYQLGSLKHLGLAAGEADPSLFVPEEVEKRVQDEWASVLQAQPLVMIHPGARGRLRQWREERFGQVADRLINHYSARLVLIGGPGEEELLNRVESAMIRKLAAKTTSLQLIEVAALLKHSRLFIGNDTATGHIAAGVGTPHIILFGPTFPHLWEPRAGKGISISKSPDCCGCTQIRCEKAQNPCMDWIGVEEVWQAVRALL